VHPQVDADYVARMEMCSILARTRGRRRLVDHDVAQRAQNRATSRAAADAGVQHVGSKGYVRCSRSRRRSGRGVAVVDSRAARSSRRGAGGQAREALELVLRERLGREQVERGRARLSSSFSIAGSEAQALAARRAVTTTVSWPARSASTARTWW